MAAETVVSHDITLGSHVLGEIAEARQRHRYNFRLTRPTTIIANLDGVFGMSSTPTLELLDAQGEPASPMPEAAEEYLDADRCIDNDCDTRSVLRAQSALRRRLQAGRYSLAVGSRANATGWFALEFVRGVGIDDAEVSEVSRSTPVEGRIERTDAKVYYKFTVDEPTDVVIRANKEEDGSLDPMVALWSADSEEITSDDGRGR